MELSGKDSPCCGTGSGLPETGAGSCPVPGVPEHAVASARTIAKKTARRLIFSTTSYIVILSLPTKQGSHKYLQSLRYSLTERNSGHIKILPRRYDVSHAISKKISSE